MIELLIMIYDTVAYAKEEKSIVTILIFLVKKKKNYFNLEIVCFIHGS